MNANFDKDGYLENYAIIGSVGGGVEVEVPEDFYQYQARAWHLVDGQLEIDPERHEAIMAAMGDEAPSPESEDPYIHGTDARLSALETDVETLAEAVNILLGVAE